MKRATAAERSGRGREHAGARNGIHFPRRDFRLPLTAVMKFHAMPLLLAGLSIAMTLIVAHAATDKPARDEFWGQPALNQAIEPGEIDRALLAAAIFHETNRVRAQLGLKPFRSHEQVDDAAETQAMVGAIFRPPSHTNPFPFIATPVDRVRQAGLNPHMVAENIALVPVYDMPDGTGLVRFEKDPRLRDARTGEVLSRHTYRSFAAVIVQAWMDSPGHRANIVDPRLRYLGCAVGEVRSMNDVEMVFGVQVFYTPERRQWRRF